MVHFGFIALAPGCCQGYFRIRQISKSILQSHQRQISILLFSKFFVFLFFKEFQSFFNFCVVTRVGSLTPHRHMHIHTRTPTRTHTHACTDTHTHAHILQLHWLDKFSAMKKEKGEMPIDQLSHGSIAFLPLCCSSAVGNLSHEEQTAHHTHCFFKYCLRGLY